MKIKCNKCEHEWNCKSDYILVSCPYCNSKVKRLQNEVKEVEESVGQVLE